MSEVFKKYDEHFEVSNMGNVKKDGEMVSQFKDEHYYTVSLYGKPKRVHEMVAECFPEICGEKKKYYHVHHKNRNQLDNRAENLICLSPRDHKRIHQLEDGVSVAVKAYDKNGVFVGRWDSKMQAAEATGIDYRHITEIINKKGRRFTAGTLYWFKEETPEEEVVSFIKDSMAEKYKTLRKSA
ncbi:MAG: HNH endonuclease [Paludibacteraceae bacterium]|nr:HNH endonuclease [Methanobrevibacter sp.]MBP5421413.1 HNH endonuclease [Paludibacteraceae bacterium]